MLLRFSRIQLVAVTFLAFLANAPSVFGESDKPTPPKCEYSGKELAEKALAAAKVTQLSRGVLPGGARVEVELPVEFVATTVYCARLVNDDRPVTIVSARQGTAEKSGITVLTLQIPPVSSHFYDFWGTRRELSLVGFQPDAAGKWDYDKPHVGINQIVKITSSRPSFWGALIVFFAAYAIAVLAITKMRKRFSMDPVVITAGQGGRASLSKLQIFGFSLIVVYLLANFLLRFGMLTDLSTDILLLLGISAAGTAGAKVAGVAKKRLSFENWSWLRNEGWLTTYEEGHSPAGEAPPKVLWSDLLKTDGEFDVYSFQLATVSVVVALSLLTSDITSLSSFTIPQNLLALLGLSNIVYVGGKAVGASLTELDDKVTAVRNAETDWITPVAATVAQAATQAKKQDVAKNGAPDKYVAYITAAREAARMLKSVYGPKGTKFTTEPIEDDQLMPTLP